jgi:hypothetical protein
MEIKSVNLPISIKPYLQQQPLHLPQLPQPLQEAHPLEQPEEQELEEGVGKIWVPSSQLRD